MRRTPGSTGLRVQAAWRLSTPGSAQWTRLSRRPQRGNPRAAGPCCPLGEGGARTVPLVSSSSMVVCALSDDSWGDAGSSGSAVASAPTGPGDQGHRTCPPSPRPTAMWQLQEAPGVTRPRGLAAHFPTAKGPACLEDPTAIWLLDILRLLVKREGTHSPCAWVDGAGGFQQVLRSPASQTAAPPTRPSPGGAARTTQAFAASQAWPRLSGGLGGPGRSPSAKHSLVACCPIHLSPGPQKVCLLLRRDILTDTL